MQSLLVLPQEIAPLEHPKGHPEQHFMRLPDERIRENLRNHKREELRLRLQAKRCPVDILGIQEAVPVDLQIRIHEILFRIRFMNADGRRVHNAAHDPVHVLHIHAPAGNSNIQNRLRQLQNIHNCSPVPAENIGRYRDPLQVAALPDFLLLFSVNHNMELPVAGPSGAVLVQRHAGNGCAVKIFSPEFLRLLPDRFLSRAVEIGNIIVRLLNGCFHEKLIPDQLLTHSVHNPMIHAQQQDRAVIRRSNRADKNKVPHVRLTLQQVEFHCRKALLPLRQIPGAISDLPQIGILPSNGTRLQSLRIPLALILNEAAAKCRMTMLQLLHLSAQLLLLNSAKSHHAGNNLNGRLNPPGLHIAAANQIGYLLLHLRSSPRLRLVPCS